MKHDLLFHKFGLNILICEISPCLFYLSAGKGGGGGVEWPEYAFLVYEG